MYPASVEYLNRQRIIPNWGGELWEQWYIYIYFTFYLFVSVYVYASVCDFVCIALILPFVLGFCMSVFLCVCFYFWLHKNFFVNNYFFLFFILITFYFILFYILLSFFHFFLPFILNLVEDRLMVLQPGIRGVPLRWESQVQDTGPQETSQLHVISNGENLPQISISMPRPSSTQRPASNSPGHLMPNN